MSNTTWNHNVFNDFKGYDMHQNWGLITQILTDNRDEVNNLLCKVKRTSDPHYGVKRQKVIIKQGETLTPIGMNLHPEQTLYNFMDDLFDYVADNGKIPPEHLAEYNELHYYERTDEEQEAYECDEEAQDASCKAEEDHREKIFETIGFTKNDYLPIKWMPYGRCHWYHPIIGLYLAKKLIPDGKWEVFETDGHTTIYSAKHKLLFDLLSWGSLNAKASTYNMLFGNEYKPATDEEFIAHVKNWLINEK